MGIVLVLIGLIMSRPKRLLPSSKLNLIFLVSLFFYSSYPIFQGSYRPMYSIPLICTLSLIPREIQNTFQSKKFVLFMRIWYFLAGAVIVLVSNNLFDRFSSASGGFTTFQIIVSAASFLISVFYLVNLFGFLARYENMKDE